MADSSVPLPEPLVMVNRYGHAASTADGDGGLFTAAQLLAYGDRRAAEERARCLAEVECGLWIDMTTAEILDSIADAIRKGA
jgi:hypothetical protein